MFSSIVFFFFSNFILNSLGLLLFLPAIVRLIYSFTYWKRKIFPVMIRHLLRFYDPVRPRVSVFSSILKISTIVFLYPLYTQRGKSLVTMKTAYAYEKLVETRFIVQRLCTHVVIRHFSFTLAKMQQTREAATVSLVMELS